MPKSFAETYDLFRQLSSEGSIPKEWGLPQFARAANDITQSQDYSAGDTGWFGGAIKKGSYWIDKGLEAKLPGTDVSLPEVAGFAGQSAFEALGGDPEKGYEAGHALPRGAIDFAPLMIPGLGEGYAMVLAGGMGAAHTYAEGGTPLQIATSAAAPKLMEIGGGLASRALARTGLTNPVEQIVGTTMTRAGMPGTRETAQMVLTDPTEKALNFLAHNLGAVGAAEVTNYATDAISQGTWNPYEGQSLYDRALGIAVSTLPFMAAGAPALVRKGAVPMGKEYVKTKETPTEEPLPDLNTLDPYQLHRRQIEADTARDMNAAMEIVDPQKRQAKLDEITKIAQGKRQALDVLHGKTPVDVVNEEAGRNPDVDNSIKALHDAFKDESLGVQSGQIGYEEAYQDYGQKLLLAHEAAKSIPEVHVDDVKSEQDIVRTTNDTQALAEVTGIEPDPTGKDTVVKALDNAGTPPDEALKSAVVGERNDTVKRVRVRTKKKVDNQAMQAGKNAAFEERKIEAHKQLIEAMDSEDVYLRDSVDKVLAAQKKAGASEGIETTWLKWKEEYLDPSKRDSSWKGKRNPMSVLEGRLGSRVIKERRDPHIAKTQLEDPDLELGRSALDVMWNDIKEAHDLTDADIAGMRANIEKGGEAAENVKRRLLYLKSKSSTQEEPSVELAKPKNTGYNEEQGKVLPSRELTRAFGEEESFYPDEFKTSDENEADFQAAGGGSFRLKTTQYWLDENGKNHAVDPDVGHVDYAHEQGWLDQSKWTSDEESMRQVYSQNKARLVILPDGRIFVENGNRELTKAQKIALEDLSFSHNAAVYVNNKLQYEAPFAAAGGARYRLKAGNDFLFRMEDPVKDASGKWMFHGKPIGRDGMMFEAGLKSVTGMKDGEMELYKLLVPEAFKDGKVDVPRLAQELKTKEPVVEIHVYGQEGSVSEAKAELAKLTHEWFETLPHSVRNLIRTVQDNQGTNVTVKNTIPSQYAEKAQRYIDLNNQVAAESTDTSPRATQFYNQISPFDTKKYPVVRVDVVLPAERRFRVTGYSGEMLGDFNTRTEADAVKSKNQGSFISEIGKLKDLWSPDDHHEDLPNTLGWVMVQFVPDPRTGETVMYVAEQQSRWGQERFKNQPVSAELESNGNYRIKLRDPVAETYTVFANSVEEAMQKAGRIWNKQFPPHPLLDLSSALSLKAAIREAQKRGVTKMVISDGESAMMTEGHDAHDLYTLNRVEGGMRLHYDKTLPSIAEKLTGEKGKMVDMGVHKNALQAEPGNADVSYGSPVFRNPDGTPKTNATGRLYDISKVEREQPLISQEGRGQGMDVQPPTNADVFQSILTKTGFSEKEVSTWTKQLQTLRDLFSIDNLKIGELINDVQGRNIAGLANMGKMREVFLSRAFTSPNEITGREVGMTFAHELGHIIDGMAGRGEIPVRFAKDIQAFKDFLAEDVAKSQEFMSMFRDTMPKEYRDLPVWDAWLKSTDPKEMYANSMAMWAASRVMGDEGRAFGLLAPQPARSWLRSLTEYARRIVGAIRGMMFGDKSLGSDLFKGGIEHVKNTFDGLTKALREGEMNMEDLNRMAIIGSPDVYVLRTSQLEDLSGNAARKGNELAQLANGRFDERHEVGLAEKIIAPFLKTLHTVGQMVPQARVPVGRLLDHAGHMQMLQNTYTAPLVGGLNKDTGTIDVRGQAYQDYRGVHANVSRPVNDFVSEFASWMQQPENKGKIVYDPQTGSNNIQQFLSSTSEEHVGYKLGPEFAKLSKEGKRHAIGYLSRIPESNRVIWESTIEGMKEQQRGLMRTMINTKDPSLFTKSDRATKLFAEGMDAAVSSDPAMQMTGQQKMEVARQIINNDGIYANMLDMWSQVQSDARLMQSKFNPWHFSMIRRGGYKVRALNSAGKEYTDILPELGANYRTWQERRRAEGYTKFQEPVDTHSMPTNISQGGDLIAALQEIEARQREKVQKLTDIPEELKQDLLANMNISGDMARYMKAGDITTPAGLKGLGMDGGRKATAGSMDMVATQQMAYGIISRINATRMMSTHLAADLLNPELSRFPSEVKQIKDALRNYMTPDTELGRAITKFTSTFYLAGNVPTHMLNLMQSYATTAAEAVNHGLSPLRAMMEISKAAIDVGKFTKDLLRWKVGLDKDHLAVSRIKDRDERALFEYMIKNGHWSFGTLGDLQDRTATGAADLNRISRTGKAPKMYESVSKPLNAFANFFMRAFAATEHFNQRIAALLGHRIAKEKMGANYNQAEAFEFAKNFMRSSTFSGGRANRPIMQGDMRTLGNVAYGLQGYTIGWLNNLYRYTAQWKGAEYLDLTPAQRQNARNAALTLLGVQFASAGALGMPFVGAALKGLETLTGQAITGNAYAKLSQMLDEDEQDGAGLANVIMNGAANAMLANSGVNIDLGSRWAMGGVFGINPHDGFSADSVFGPTGQTVANIVGALKSTVGGDLANAANQISPPALKKAIALWRNGGEIRTASGAPVESTVWEKLAYSLGFTPLSVSNLNQYQSYKRQVDASLDIQNKRDAGQILTALQTDPLQGRAALTQIASKTGEDPQQVAARVAKLAADQAFPVDIRRGTGSRTGQELMSIARAVGVNPGPSAEVARGSYMQEIMRVLGVRPSMIGAETYQRDEVGDALTPYSVFHRGK